MIFKEAYEALKNGCKVKCPEWTGYWEWENNTIMMHCADGITREIRHTENLDYTMSFILRSDWQIVGAVDASDEHVTFSFGVALERLKAGQKVCRIGWNGKGMFVVYQKAYPEGIPCNKQTAEAWGLQEGDLFICNPYLQIKQVNGSHSMWVPSIGDVLAEDWMVVE